MLHRRVGAGRGAPRDGDTDQPITDIEHRSRRGGPMQYDEFIETVADRAGLPRGSAESVTHAVLQVLAERISGGEALDLAAQLPRELQPDLDPPQEDARAFGAGEFARRVAARADVDEISAETGMVAVLTTLRDAVTPGEYDDVLSQLGREFSDLVR
jgi:uncharacterized protein (DUF2267 family)